MWIFSHIIKLNNLLDLLSEFRKEIKYFSHRYTTTLSLTEPNILSPQKYMLFKNIYLFLTFFEIGRLG